MGRAFRRGNQSRRQVVGLQLLVEKGGRKGARDAHRGLAVRDGGIDDSRGVEGLLVKFRRVEMPT